MNSMPLDVSTLGSVVIGVLDAQRKYVEKWAEYRYIGKEIIVVPDLETQEFLKVAIYVYKVAASRTLEGLPYGFWLRTTKPQMWKRVDCPNADSD